MGSDGAAWLARQPELESMVIDDRDRVLLTPGFAALRVPTAPEAQAARPLPRLAPGQAIA